MNKILIKLKYPLVSQEYELFIPNNKTVGKIVQLIEKTITEFNVGEIIPRTNAILIKADNNTILDQNKLVSDSNIKQGDTLIIL